MRRNWTTKEELYLKENYGLLSAREIGIKLNRSLDSVRGKISRMDLEPVKTQIEFAIYHDDDFKFIGNRKECADFLGVDERTITFYSSPFYKRRTKTGLFVINIGRWEVIKEEIT